MRFLAGCHPTPGPKAKADDGTLDPRLCSSFWFPDVRKLPTDDPVSLVFPDSRCGKLRHGLNGWACGGRLQQKRGEPVNSRVFSRVWCDCFVVKPTHQSRVPKSPRFSAGCLCRVGTKSVSSGCVTCPGPILQVILTMLKRATALRSFCVQPAVLFSRVSALICSKPLQTVSLLPCAPPCDQVQLEYVLRP